MHPDPILTPAGILEVSANPLNIVFGTSRETSDFVADALDWWWTSRRDVYSHIRRLQIDLDTGPEIASSRTQFMKRLVDFSDRHQLSLEMAYYPPYHSKYNPVERCWGILVESLQRDAVGHGGTGCGLGLNDDVARHPADRPSP